MTIIRRDIIILTCAASFALQVGTVFILCLRVALRVPANPQREITIVPPLRQKTDRSETDSSNSLELKSDGHLQCGSTHDPHPNCAGTERVQTLAGTADDTNGLSENVASHCASQVQLTAHANAFMESFYKTLKYEEVHLWNYETYEDVIERLPFFLEEVYNRKRLHSSIGYVPPAEFEATILNMKPADRPVLNL
jgi:hypothetical protein